MLLPPFEMAIRESGVRSVMNSYTDLDGIPTAADAGLLTDLLREVWGFDGTVVADYFSIAFLKELHGYSEDWTAAARDALSAGIDVELPDRQDIRRRPRARRRRRRGGRGADRPRAPARAAAEGRARDARSRLVARAARARGGVAVGDIRR